MLIDTDIFIWLLRGNIAAAEFLDSLDEYSISDITYMELIQGTRSKNEMKLLIDLLEEMKVRILPVNEQISQKASDYVMQYSHSHSMQVCDALIAATAYIHHLPLASGNGKHFSPLSEVKLHVFTP